MWLRCLYTATYNSFSFKPKYIQGNVPIKIVILCLSIDVIGNLIKLTEMGKFMYAPPLPPIPHLSAAPH